MLPFIQIPAFVLSLFLLVISISFKWIMSNSRNKKNLPPSPWKLPLIGNLHQLGPSLHRSLWDMAKKHGPVMLVHVGSVPLLVATSVEASQLILKTHDLIFCNRPHLKIANKLFYGSKDIAFAPYGEHWRQMKSIAVLQLLSNKRVQSYRKVREEETALMLHEIGESCGSLVNLNDLFVAHTNNVVCRVALGKTYRELKFRNLLSRLIGLLGHFSIGSYIPLLSWVDRLSGIERKTNEVTKEFDDVLEDVIEEHVKRKREMNGGNEGQDLVDVLLDCQRESAGGFVIDKDTIKAVILEIFAAGTYTTSAILEWGISELIKHPRVMKKLQKEVTEIANGRPVILEDDLDQLKYLKAVIKETLRFHAPVPLLVQRETTQDVKLMGYDIAAGTSVVINAWAIARDPTVWEDPEEFKPERFLNSSIDYKGSQHYEFIPFGGGRRGCPGAQFAVAVNEVAIANLVYKYDLALPNGKGGEELDMTELPGIAAHRKTPLLVVATPRF